MDSRNPFSTKTEIGSSSKQQTVIGEDGSSSNQPRPGVTITNQCTKDTYLLIVKIGSFSNGRCPVYKALFSRNKPRSNGPVPRGYVSLKIIDMKLHRNEFKLIQHQLQTHLYLPECPKIIRSKKTFFASNLLCVSFPYMSEGSLRSILSTRPEKKLPEHLIPVVLKQVLIGLRDEIHDFCRPTVHKSLNAGDIFVNINDDTNEVSINLAFELSVYDSGSPFEQGSLYLNPNNISMWGAAPEVFGSENEDNRGEKSDMWLLGITALELVYGNLPVKNRTDLNYIINKLREKKKFPKSLEKMIIKRDNKLKKVMDLVKRKKRVFSREFEEMVLSCLRENPDDRPTAFELLNTPFFNDFEKFKQFVLIDQ
ncbi:serine/threonine-protein kinase BLUS1-like [Solanum pennellii]|uniref:Serine/threonine-protein kinase BLUS1-like n=1 Tax=Solanum pennellii TaxID=28526 RepID=A0ABM1HSM4_SOLPN|nr:serine/threonine-protein kinase BLUS1-like [Solanum pennellii]